MRTRCDSIAGALVAQLRVCEIRSAHDSHLLEKKKTKKDQSKTKSFLYVGGKLNDINIQELDATGMLMNLQSEKWFNMKQEREDIRFNKMKLGAYLFHLIRFEGLTHGQH